MGPAVACWLAVPPAGENGVCTLLREGETRQPFQYLFQASHCDALTPPLCVLPRWGESLHLQSRPTAPKHEYQGLACHPESNTQHQLKFHLACQRQPLTGGGCREHPIGKASKAKSGPSAGSILIEQQPKGSMLLHLPLLQ